jgi:hypothetical protein
MSKSVKRMCKTIILPVFVYGCEHCSPILREKHGLRMFGNTVPRKIFGTERDEVAAEWRKLHKEHIFFAKYN